MRNDGYYQREILNFLAVPLMLLSAVYCLMPLFRLPPPDVSAAAVCLFAAVIYAAKQRFDAIKMLLATGGVSLLCYAAFAVYTALLPSFAAILKSRYVLYGAIAAVDKLLFGNTLTEQILRTDYSGAMLTASGLVTGAADIFAANPGKASASVSQWLSGAYFGSLFLPFGLLASVWKLAGKRERLLLVCTAAAAVFSGDASFFLVAAVLIQPLSIPLYCVVSALAYWCSARMDFRIGFASSPSLFELVRYRQSLLLFLLTGAVLAAVQYYSVAWLGRRTEKYREEKEDESS